MPAYYPTEHEEQVTFIDWLRIAHPKVAEMTTAIPNGGHRHKAVAAKLKAEGVSDGFPDILIDYPVGLHHGMRIEMKRQKSSPSDWRPSQREWNRRLNERGYYAVVCHGYEDALFQVEAYLADAV